MGLEGARPGPVSKPEELEVVPGERLPTHVLHEVSLRPRVREQAPNRSDSSCTAALHTWANGGRLSVLRNGPATEPPVPRRNGQWAERNRYWLCSQSNSRCSRI